MRGGCSYVKNQNPNSSNTHESAHPPSSLSLSLSSQSMCPIETQLQFRPVHRPILSPDVCLTCKGLNSNVLDSINNKAEPITYQAQNGIAGRQAWPTEPNTEGCAKMGTTHLKKLQLLWFKRSAWTQNVFGADHHVKLPAYQAGIAAKSASAKLPWLPSQLAVRNHCRCCCLVSAKYCIGP
jgi:hypothetical protein